MTTHGPSLRGVGVARAALAALLAAQASCPPACAGTPGVFRAADLIEAAGLSERQRRSLSQGEIVALGLSELEQSPKELAALLLVQVPADLRAIAGFIHSRKTFGLADSTDERVASVDGDVAGALHEVVQVEAGSGEVEGLMSVSPGDTFNLGPAEIEAFERTARRLRGEGAGEAEKARALSATYRELLARRVEAYRDDGLDGIIPYARSDGEQADPGAELRLAVQSVDLLERRYPDFRRALLQYPEGQPPSIRHRHFVLRKIVRDRPAYVLSHWLLDIRDDHALLVERQYYVGHTYNSLQVGVLCLPGNEGTLVALLNQTFTGRVAGLFGGLRHHVGRQRIMDSIRPLFEDLRGEFRGR